MKKILVINNIYRNYGGEDSNIIDELIFLKKYFQVEYLEFDNRNPIDKNDFLGLLFNSNRSSNKKVESLIKSFKPDIAYVHNSWFKANLGIFKILKLNSIKTYNKIHNYRLFCGGYLLSKKHFDGKEKCLACGKNKIDNKYFNFYYKNSIIKSIFLFFYTKKYLKFINKKYMNLILLTKFQKSFFENIGLDSNIMHVIPNPVNLTNDNRIKYNSSSNYMCYVGRLTVNKGVEDLLDTWLKIQPNNLVLKVVGTGEEEKRLKMKYASKRIEFTGFQNNEDAKKIIENSRAIVISSKTLEAQPRVIFEALSKSVPIIFPNFSGLNEFFPIDYELSYEQFNLKSLQNSLLKIQDEKFLSIQGKKAYENFVLNFSPKKIMNRFNLLIENEKL